MGGDTGIWGGWGTRGGLGDTGVWGRGGVGDAGGCDTRCGGGDAGRLGPLEGVRESPDSWVPFVRWGGFRGGEGVSPGGGGALGALGGGGRAARTPGSPRGGGRGQTDKGQVGTLPPPPPLCFPPPPPTIGYFWDPSTPDQLMTSVGHLHPMAIYGAGPIDPPPHNPPKNSRGDPGVREPLHPPPPGDTGT